MHPTAMKVIAITAIVVPMLGLILIGTAFLLDGHDTPSRSWHRVARLSELPNDGTPVLIPVYRQRFDAWMRLPDERIWDVYVRKETGSDNVSVVQSWHHSHLRIPIRYDSEEKQYVSLCWNVAFDMQGRQLTDRETKTEPIDFDIAVLPVKVNDGEVWVRIDAAMQ
jgi:hypothetical protein